MIRKALRAIGWWVADGAKQQVSQAPEIAALDQRLAKAEISLSHLENIEESLSRLGKIEESLSGLKSLETSLLPINQLVDLLLRIETINSDVRNACTVQVQEIHALRKKDPDLLFEISAASGRYSDPRSLTRFQTSIYSQNGEDGVIAEIFSRIGTTNRYFLEVGIEDGTQNNTRFLLEQGWKGTWIEGDEVAAARAKSNFSQFVESGHLQIISARVGPQNIMELINSHNIPSEIDFISLDIDQATSHLWSAVTLRARAACIEYNASIPASSPVETPYDPGQNWDGTNWFGAGLKRLEQIGRGKGLDLVGCDLLGVNAFFVANTLTEGKFQGPFTSEQHWEPARYGTQIKRGHPTSNQARHWLRSEA